MANKRAISVDELLKKKFKNIEFEGEWKKLFGVPEMSGVWIIWGDSGSGKSRFTMLLAKALTQFGKVAYNALEEGARKSIQKNIIDCNMKEVKSKFIILNREPIEELKVRLRKKKSPDILIIDSIQYTGLTKKEYIALKEEFPNKLFIFISHAEGKNPLGSVAGFIRYDSDIKIFIKWYRAFAVSRLGVEIEDTFYNIWPERAAVLWAELN